MFERAILHLDLDAFFVSVEQQRNSALKGKPLIIGGTSARGVVASCSYEARAYGVHSAMPIKMALRLCPDAIVLRGDMEAYSHQSKIITEIIREEAPLFEKASIDEFYLDLTGMDRHFGCWLWSKELRQKVIRETGLPLSLGLSVNKLVSKVGAGEAKPNGARLVEAGTERAFLAPLPVRKLPSVGQATCKKLSFMGVRTVQVLSQIPPLLLQREFGQPGLSLWKKANGIDNSPVVPYTDKQSISTEHTFQVDTIDMQSLRDQITDMVMKLAFELRQSQKLTSCIAVKLRYTDFNTFSKQRKIPYTANDQALIGHAHELLERLYERRQLVRLVGVRFSGLVQGNPQLNLFDASEAENRLMQALDRIRKRFGQGAVRRARH
ncbi:MAG: DNA polymerase IV [Lewinellaceae bacterium]|nr:DNA polymerase IV [Phaeodactylibacter sp.]MCB0611797.1 DNA polymerase IV [Phaeodactylibacter sp.]MCB9348523.1 DNA polymerase IV [Lewinellaceae bacterium]